MKAFGGVPIALEVYDETKLLTFAEKCGASDWFGVWMILVDRYLLKRIGLTTGDLADQTYYDWYEDGINPKEAAQLVLESDDMDWLGAGV